MGSNITAQRIIAQKNVIPEGDMSVVQPVGHWRLSQQLPETSNTTTYRHKKGYTSINYKERMGIT